MACDCQECRDFGGPNPGIMKMKFYTGLIPMYVIGILGMLKERRWKELRVFLATLSVFLTIPRYLICARCDGYGKNCYALYLGKLTSLYLPKVEGKKVPWYGLMIEAICLVLLGGTPAWALRKNWKLFGLYSFFSEAMFLMHLNHACRHCMRNATDWRAKCLIGLGGNLIFGYLDEKKEA